MDSNESSGAPTAEQLERLAGKILLDTEFRQSFFAAPQQMTQSLFPTIELTADQLKVLGSLDQEEVEHYAEELVEEIGRVQIAYWLAPEAGGIQGPGDLPII